MTSTAAWTKGLQRFHSITFVHNPKYIVVFNAAVFFYLVLVAYAPSVAVLLMLAVLFFGGRRRRTQHTKDQELNWSLAPGYHTAFLVLELAAFITALSSLLDSVPVFVAATVAGVHGAQLAELRLARHRGSPQSK